MKGRSVWIAEVAVREGLWSVGRKTALPDMHVLILMELRAGPVSPL